jgi:hypothetical protein
MGYDLSSLPDVKYDSNVVENNQTGSNQNSPPNNNANNNNQTDSSYPLSDYLISGAGLYGARQVAKSNILPTDAINLAKSSRASNQSFEDAKNLHAQNMANLQDAQREADYWKSDQAIIDNLHPNTPDEVVHAIAGTTPEQPMILTRKPVGGEGTQNYAKKSGATDVQALNAPSMSTVQQETIPDNTVGLKTIKVISPTAVQVEESPLMLDYPGQKAKLDLLRQEKTQEEALDSIVKDTKNQTLAKIQPNVDAANANLVKAQANVNQSEDALGSSISKQSQNNASYTNRVNTLNPGQQSQLNRIASAGNVAGDVISAGGRLLRRVATPLGVAAIPEEIRAGNEQWNTDKLGALKHYGTAALSGIGGLAEGALALGFAPEIAAGTAAGAGLAGAGMAAYDAGKYINEHAPNIRDFFSDKKKQMVGGN